MAGDHPTEYAERDEAAYTRFTATRGPLLGDKGGEFQRDFLTAAQHPSTFVEFMDEHVPAVAGARISSFAGALTEQSFKEMTVDQEEDIYDAWRDLTARVACRVSFWADVTIQHIDVGVLEEASWLAANGGRNESGEERIDRALAKPGEEGSRLIDDCVRTILRRMSGLPSARGNRSVFVNPSFARAWWRERLVARISAREGVEDRRTLRDVVRSSQQYWENLTTMIVSRGSVFGSVDVQDAFVNGLAKHLKGAPGSPLKSASSLTTALRRFSNIAASRELGVLEFEEVSAIVDDFLHSVAETLTN